jgi:hypothetical protein
MRPCLLLLFLISFSKAGLAQNDADSQAFIRSVFHDEKAVYADAIDESRIMEMRWYLKRKSFNKVIASGLNKNSPGKLILNQKEEEYINHELSLMKYNVWADGLLKGSVLVKTGTLDKIFKKNSLSTAWQYIYKHYGDGFYTLGKPIFLRNNTVCVFYSSYNCGMLCGKGGLYIYLKKNVIWKKQYTLYSWIS